MFLFTEAKTNSTKRKEYIMRKRTFICERCKEEKEAGKRGKLPRLCKGCRFKLRKRFTNCKTCGIEMEVGTRGRVPKECPSCNKQYLPSFYRKVCLICFKEIKTSKDLCTECTGLLLTRESLKECPVCGSFQDKYIEEERTEKKTVEENVDEENIDD